MGRSTIIKTLETALSAESAQAHLRDTLDEIANNGGIDGGSDSGNDSNNNNNGGVVADCEYNYNISICDPSLKFDTNFSCSGNQYCQSFKISMTSINSIIDDICERVHNCDHIEIIQLLWGELTESLKKHKEISIAHSQPYDQNKINRIKASRPY
ncbi:MAG: hypothetical protein ABIJ97_11770 [Bacteroidota bacterium]